jgi:uncharacterized protein (TIGR01244 family)
VWSSCLAAMLALLAGTASASAAEYPEIPHQVQPSENGLNGGQPDEAALRQAAEAGIRVVVNLRGEGESIDFDESQTVMDLGMTYLHLPISGATDLTPENVAAFGNLLAAIGDQPVLMHCASGNRVGALHALHAGWHLGLDPDEAIELGRANGLTGLEESVRERLESRATE